jgi:GNAT superfamily N-acetyltransferase
MSPEQVRGHPADARSDIFSFGAVLYEILTGKLAFGGETHAERGYAILNREPPKLTASGVSVPSPVERLLRRCLEKSREERFQSARDLAFALEVPAEGSTPSERAAAAAASMATAPRRRRRNLARALIAVLLLAVAAVGGAWLGRTTDAPSASSEAAAVATAAAPKFTRITFRAGAYYRARFAPDGRSIIYSGQIEGAEPQVFTTTPGQPHARALSPPAHQLHAVSSREQMAIGAPAPETAQGRWYDTLSIASLAGGSPREVLEEVYCADFAPDGVTLAIVRDADQVEVPRLEYPVGTVLRTFQDLDVHDIARDGRVLLSTGAERTHTFGVVPGTEREANLSWFDGTHVVNLSADGRTLLFMERGEAVAARPHAFVRRTDGSPAIDLGPGWPRGLSPDSKWALVSPAEAPATLTLVPLGPGSARKLDPGKIAEIFIARWLPDGKRISLLAAEAGESGRIFIQDLSGGPPRATTKPGVQFRGLPSPDGRLMIVTFERQGGSFTMPVEGGTLRRFDGLKWSDMALVWTSDGKGIFVLNNGKYPSCCLPGLPRSKLAALS